MPVYYDNIRAQSPIYYALIVHAGSWAAVGAAAGLAFGIGLGGRDRTIRAVLEEEKGVGEKKMFGGVAFLVDGKMFVGIVKQDLMVRVGPERYRAALKRKHVRPMDFTGKPMEGYVYVAPEGVAEDDQLAEWVRLGAAFARSLPAKGGRRR